jgi:DNA topoisomerase-3
MSEPERKVYDAIRRRYLAQFFPPFVYEATVILTECSGATFKTTGKVALSPGWKVVLSDEPEEGDNEEGAANLPKVSTGDAVTCQEVKRHDRETKPPARFTEGTLIAAMAGIARFVDDPEVKKRLKETAGIGTEATRAGIIETLKKRGYLETKGKALISTATARRFIAALPPNIYDPATTATWEQALEGIAEGRITLERFMASQRAWITNEVDFAKSVVLSGLSSSGPRVAAKSKAKRGGKKGGARRATA